MLDPQEEAKFDELKAMCRELKVPSPPEIMIGLKVHDKDGNLTFDDVQRGHSWTRNFWQNIGSFLTGGLKGDASGLFGAGYMSFKANIGTIYSNSSYSGGMPTYTIVVGTGDTAFNVNDYAMAGLIANGTGSGQFSYQSQSAVSRSYAAKVWKGTFSRIMNNNSGGSITVKETGFNAELTAFGANTDTCLSERSVLSPTVAVANGAQFTVTYEISMDFSAID